MTEHEAIEELNAMPTHHVDREELHSRADEILLAMLETCGKHELTSVWRATRERIGFEY